MRIMRRGITAVTVFSLFLSLLTAEAAHAVAYTPENGTGTVACDDGTVFEIEDNVLTDGYSCVGEAVIPEGVTSIGDSAFADSDVTSIKIPSSVTSIDADALDSIYILEAFEVASSNNFFSAVGGVLFTKNGATLIKYPTAKSGPYEVPVDVVTIRDEAFEGSTELTHVSFATNSQLTSIGEQAFSRSSIMSVTFSENSQLTSIGSRAFQYSTLSSIIIPASVSSIGFAAFQRARMSNFGVAVSNNSFKVEQGVLFSKNGETLLNAFNKAGAYEVPASVKVIESEAFSDSSGLTHVSFATNSQLTSIGSDSFSYTALTVIEFPASLTSIGNFAFFYIPSLRSIEFPENSQLTTIGDDVFRNSGISALVIPSSVTSIGRSAFAVIGNLSSVTFAANSQLRSIGDYAFSEALSLRSVQIPASVVSIGEASFSHTPVLEAITFEEGSQLQSIGGYAFEGSRIIETISIPAGVASIGFRAFSNTNANSDIFFLGNAPSATSSFSAGNAYVSACATGFPESGVWGRLALNFDDTSTTCSVIYNLSGGTGSTSAALVFGRIAEPTSPSRAGYTFSGWSETSGGDTIGAFPYSPSSTDSNTTIYANWTPNTNAVIYNTGGGSQVPNSSFATGGQIPTAPVSPTRVGFEFNGWVLSGRIIRFPYSPVATSDITLDAAWIPIQVPFVPDAVVNPPAQAPSGPQNNSQPSPPQNVPQPNPPQVMPPVVLAPVALVPVASYTMVFSSGSNSMATRGQSDIKTLVTKSGPDAKYTISAGASLVRGLPRSFVSNLAKARAAKIRAYLIKIGVRSADITIKLVVNKTGQAPATKITVKR